MNEIPLALTLEEFQRVFDLMGDTPTKFGFWPIMLKMKAQFDAAQKEATDGIDQSAK